VTLSGLIAVIRLTIIIIIIMMMMMMMMMMSWNTYVAAWISGRLTCIYLHKTLKFFYTGPVTSWMGDLSVAGKPSRYVTNHLGQLSFPSLRGRQIEHQPVWLGLRVCSLVSGGR